MATREQTYSRPDSHERAITQVLTRGYALNWEVVAYAVILVLAVFTRFVDLGARVMSHDESLHTYYSWRLYEYGEFSHTPLMHGPLLFHMTALSYFLFGDNDFTARIYPALLGALVVLFPLLLRRWLGRVGAVITSILLLISPELLYYSRYIRHDIPLIFFVFVLIWAMLEYLDGERPRRAVWVGVMSAALLGMLASKEVAFIYIAIFGSFMVLVWLLRMVQDIGVQRPPRDGTAWQAPLLQRALGHLLLVGLVGVVALMVGSFVRFMLLSELWIPSAAWIVLPLFLMLYLPLVLSGVIRQALGRAPGGAASAIMRWLSRGRSAFNAIVAGVILGALVALLIVCLTDVIKPAQIWTETTVRSQYDLMYGANSTKEYAVQHGFDSAAFVHLLTWTALPVLVMIFALFLSAVLHFPGHIPLPWKDMLIILLIAFITASVLVMFERRSFVAQNGGTPFAADVTTTSQTTIGHYQDGWIVAAWVIGVLLTLGVVVTRLFTNWWNFLNRQPLFDVLIVLGTLVLPWLAAYPLYRAGYDLESYDPNTLAGRDTLQASLPAVLPFLMLSISVGVAWNWKRWVPAAMIFLGLFAFFFTTVFSNQYGLVTGVIGSLGYWLEQQGVRRGSQPQYYYVLTQLPVYEFLPLIGSLCAGVFGLGRLWAWRRARVVAEREAEAVYAVHSVAADEMGADEFAAPATLVAAQPDQAALEDAPDTLPEDYAGDGETSLRALPRLLRPWTWADEQARRASDPEWIGSFPFLALVGYWAITIVFALTIAGEKMPWLTTHLTIPLILLTGWWLGQVIEGLRGDAMRNGGWLALLVTLPLAFLALGEVVQGLWSANPPFQGRSVQALTASGNWFAALLVLLGTLYVVGRLGRRVGLEQLGRVAIVSGAIVLAVLTARIAILAAYINYDYATEFLVYAHAGPAVKTVLNEVNRIAQITNEGTNMRIVFDDESSWPYTWYFRDYPNYGYIRGESGSVNASDLDGARVVVVGNKKAGDVRRILGDQYYEFDYIRLWWPMQEYFNLTYDRVANVFSTDDHNVAARYYRQGIWDIWWRRDYSTYAQAMCIDAKQFRCDDEASQGTTQAEQDAFRASCEQSIIAECKGDDRFDVSQWPVSDRLYFFVDKDIAAQVWDAGIGSATVDIREPEYPEDLVYEDRATERIVGEAASMLGPRGVAVDAEGQIYVCDTERSRVVVLSSTGEYVRSIGDAGQVAAPAALKQPWGIALASDGTVYVADTWNNRVAVYSPSGDFLRTWGHEGVAPADTSGDAMWGPRDIAVGPDGNVYVADTGGKRIRVYSPDGTWLRDIGSGGSNFGQVDEPVGLAFNPVSHELYVAEAWNKRIQVFNLDGLPLRTFDVNMWFHNTQSFNRPYLAVSPDGTLIYVTDMDDRHRIVAYNLDGQPAFAFNQPDDLTTGTLGLRSPAGLAVDTAGRLYVVDSEQAEVFVFPPPEISGSVVPVPAQDGYSSTVPEVEPTTVPDAGSAGQSQTPADAQTEPPEVAYPVGASVSDWTPVVQTVQSVPFVSVPSGCWLAGPESLESGGGTELCLSAFWISQTEVTNVQYAVCVTLGACTPPADLTYYADPIYANAPVVNVTWQQAADYAAWIGGTLPTEAQWEFAARGPQSLVYPWGDAEPTCERANTEGCGGLLPVGAELRSAGASWVGALDMAGSVWEWTADWFKSSPFTDLAPGTFDPAGPSEGTERAVRGASWQDAGVYANAAFHEGRDPAVGTAAIGFRVVVTSPGEG